LSALMQQHEQWTGAKSRLWNREPPPPKSAPPRPVSPFEIERVERLHFLEKQRAEFMKQMVVEAQQAVAPWRKIVMEVAEAHQVSVRDILGPTRFRHVVYARQEAMYRVRNEIVIRGEPMSYPEIGRKFGGRDHSTVLHSMRAHARRVKAAANA
jgi:chromosomal replication initiation ATPase DnaA